MLSIGFGDLQMTSPSQTDSQETESSAQSKKEPLNEKRKEIEKQNEKEKENEKENDITYKPSQKSLIKNKHDLALNPDDMIYVKNGEVMEMLTVVQEISRGSFGIVYECYLSDTTNLTFKKTNDNNQKDKEPKKSVVLKLSIIGVPSNKNSDKKCVPLTVSQFEAERTYLNERNILQLLQKDKNIHMPELLFEFHLSESQIIRKQQPQSQYHHANKEKELILQYGCLVFPIYETTLSAFRSSVDVSYVLVQNVAYQLLASLQALSEFKMASDSSVIAENNNNNNNWNNSNNNLFATTTNNHSVGPHENNSIVASTKTGLCSVVTKEIDETHGLIHADLKPKNIMINYYPDQKRIHLRLIDFGLSRTSQRAKLIHYHHCAQNLNPFELRFHYHLNHSKINWNLNSDAAKQYETMDYYGSMDSGKNFPYVQSRYYRAPETILGTQITPAIDCFSAGVLLWEFATGQYLFPADSELELLWKFVELFGYLPKQLLQDADPSALQLFFNEVRNTTNTNDSNNGSNANDNDLLSSLTWYHLKTLNKGSFLPQNYIPGSRNLMDELIQYQPSWSTIEQKNFVILILKLILLNPLERLTAKECLETLEFFA